MRETSTTKPSLDEARQKATRATQDAFAAERRKALREHAKENLTAADAEDVDPPVDGVRLPLAKQ